MNQLQPQMPQMPQMPYIPNNQYSIYEMEPNDKNIYSTTKDTKIKYDTLAKFYNELNKRLKTSNNKDIDPYNLIYILNKGDSKLNSIELEFLYKHLLHYTYASTVSEIKNHEEVNLYLREIHKLLKKLVKEDPVVGVSTTP
jgi:hypothetical protein